MQRSDTRPILAMVAGYWPAPTLAAEEITAWVTELCGPASITPEEARTAIIAEAESGREFRMKPGQLVGAVQALRRRRVLDGTVPALSAGWSNVAPPDRARQWCRALRRVARGEDLEAAKIAEGVS